MAQTAKCNDKSNEIMDQIKRKRLIEIFKLLDSDNDGYISSA